MYRPLSVGLRVVALCDEGDAVIAPLVELLRYERDRVEERGDACHPHALLGGCCEVQAACRGVVYGPDLV
jgi:hypothetical protein